MSDQSELRPAQSGEVPTEPALPLRRPSSRLGLGALGFAIVLAAGITIFAIEGADPTWFTVCTLLMAAIYSAAVVMVLRRTPHPRDVVVILGIALVLRTLALAPAPNLSTDAFRYVWDGRIQSAGFNPYLYVPADPRLANLRDDAIYPKINQKETAVTIYPPAAELLFLAADRLAPGIGGIRLVMTLLDATIIAGLLLLLWVIGQPRERVLIYAWHPLPLWEFVTQSHIDVAATAAIVLALLAAVGRRQGIAGAIMAVAVLVKYFPLVLLPAIWRRFDWRLPITFLATALLLYLPYVQDAGSQMLGFLGSHLDNEGYAAGWGFHPVWLLRDVGLGDPSAGRYVTVASTLLAGLAAYTLCARAIDQIRFDFILLLGVAFVFLTSPHYPWYFGFLVALLVLAPNPAVFAMTLLAPLLYLPRTTGGLSWTEIYFAVYWLPIVIFAAHSLWTSTRKIHVETAVAEAVEKTPPPGPSATPNDTGAGRHEKAEPGRSRDPSAPTLQNRATK